MIFDEDESIEDMFSNTFDNYPFTYMQVEEETKTPINTKKFLPMIDIVKDLISNLSNEDLDEAYRFIATTHLERFPSEYVSSKENSSEPKYTRAEIYDLGLMGYKIK